MEKQNPGSSASPAADPGAQFSPVPGDEAAELKAIYEQYRQAIEFHSKPEYMTFAQLVDTDNL